MIPSPFVSEVVPLRRYLRKGMPFIWDQAAEKSFTRAKKLLSSSKTVRMFDPDLPIIVTTDASAYGLGALLQQLHGTEVQTVAFASHTLTTAEHKYSAEEREALACLWACERWHTYLWGRRFKLRTDHQALAALLNTRGNGLRPLRITRWSTRFLKYNFQVEYQRGSENQVADVLSRLPVRDVEGGTQFNEEIVSFVFLDSECITKRLDVHLSPSYEL